MESKLPTISKEKKTRLKRISPIFSRTCKPIKLIAITIFKQYYTCKSHLNKHEKKHFNNLVFNRIVNQKFPGIHKA